MLYVRAYSEVYEQHSEVKINSTYLDATDLIKNDEKWIQTPLGSENEVYCPPSPVPKKSILKDSGALAKVKQDLKVLKSSYFADILCDRKWTKKS